MNLNPDLPSKTIAAINRLLQNNSYLQEVGWFNSSLAELPVNRQGKALPWYTYPAIAFLEDKVKEDMSAFEYGSGTSTIWWSDHVNRVVSCEHDKEWYQKLAPNIAGNVDYIYFDLIPGGNYSKAIKKFNDEFDIVVIDGRDRVNCVKNSLYSLKQGGVIVWDNSERKHYNEGYTYLLTNGFKRLDFWGLGPINAYGWCTSVFYKPNNCFGI